MAAKKRGVAIKQITHEMRTRLCNIDYEREIAIVAEIKKGEKRPIIGIGRLIMEPDGRKAKLAVLVHDHFHGKGLSLSRRFRYIFRGTPF